MVSHHYLDYLTNWPQYGYKTVGRTRLSVAQGLSREEFWLPSFSLSTLQTSQTTQPTSKSSLTIWRGWREYKELIQGFVGWCQWYWNAGKNKELVMDFHRCKLYFLWSIMVQYQYWKTNNFIFIFILYFDSFLCFLFILLCVFIEFAYITALVFVQINYFTYLYIALDFILV